MLIVFDLDGTLLNTIEDLSAAANYALHTCGFPKRSVEQCRQFVGNGVSKLLERCLPSQARTSANLATMERAFFAYYGKHLTAKTVPYPGIIALLIELQKRTIKLAVASNKYQQATEELIGHFFPQIAFSAVLGQRENVPLKPNPQIVYELLTLTGETVANCLYVGDSAVDMQTAQNAGVRACGVTWGFYPKEGLASYHPNWLIDSPLDLLRFL